MRARKRTTPTDTPTEVFVALLAAWCACPGGYGWAWGLITRGRATWQGVVRSLVTQATCEYERYTSLAAARIDIPAVERLPQPYHGRFSDWGLWLLRHAENEADRRNVNGDVPQPLTWDTAELRIRTALRKVIKRHQRRAQRRKVRR